MVFTSLKVAILIIATGDIDWIPCDIYESFDQTPISMDFNVLRYGQLLCDCKDDDVIEEDEYIWPVMLAGLENREYNKLSTHGGYTPPIRGPPALNHSKNL